MDTRLDATLSELRQQVIAAHRDRQPLRLRGAGTKDFYGDSTEADSAAGKGLADHAAADHAAAGNTAAGHAAAVPATPGHTAAGPRPAARLLDLRPYQGIVDYEPSELVITARCGTPLSAIESALAERGQFLAFEPPALGGGDPTIGGVIAAGLSGPRRMYAGAARDFVLGATLLDARGDLLRFGGQVMKNVAGFDVSRLLCGSLGILGIIADVSLKVLPQPRAEETLRFELLEQDAIATFNRWSGQPLPISGASWSEGSAYVRLSGAASAVRAAQDRLGGERLDPTAATQWWNALRHCSHPIFNNASIWRLCLPDTAPPLKLRGEVLIDWGGALRWYAGAPDGAHEAVVRRTDSIADVPRNGATLVAGSMHHGARDPATPAAGSTAYNGAIRETAAAAGGTAICWRGPAPLSGRFHPLQPAVTALHRRLKDRFDPHGIFNPGRLIAGL